MRQLRLSQRLDRRCRGIERGIERCRGVPCQRDVPCQRGVGSHQVGVVLRWVVQAGEMEDEVQTCRRERREGRGPRCEDRAASGAGQRARQAGAQLVLARLPSLASQLLTEEYEGVPHHQVANHVEHLDPAEEGGARGGRGWRLGRRWVEECCQASSGCLLSSHRTHQDRLRVSQGLSANTLLRSTCQPGEPSHPNVGEQHEHA